MGLVSLVPQVPQPCPEGGRMAETLGCHVSEADSHGYRPKRVADAPRAEDTLAISGQRLQDRQRRSAQWELAVAPALGPLARHPDREDVPINSPPTIHHAQCVHDPFAR